MATGERRRAGPFERGGRARRVVALESSWDADTIYTDVTLDVLEAWGLPGSPARIVVKQLGGAVDDVALKIGGQARFEIGEEVFLFLDVRPRDHTLSVAGLEHGKWTLTASTAAAAAMAREVRGDDADTVVARDVRPVAALRELAGLVGTRRQRQVPASRPRPPPSSMATRAIARRSRCSTRARRRGGIRPTRRRRSTWTRRPAAIRRSPAAG